MKKRNMKVLALLMTVTMAGTMLAGCGDSGSTSTGSSGGATASSSGTADASSDATAASSSTAEPNVRKLKQCNGYSTGRCFTCTCL